MADIIGRSQRSEDRIGIIIFIFLEVHNYAALDF